MILILTLGTDRSELVARLKSLAHMYLATIWLQIRRTVIAMSYKCTKSRDREGRSLWDGTSAGAPTQLRAKMTSSSATFQNAGSHSCMTITSANVATSSSPLATNLHSTSQHVARSHEADHGNNLQIFLLLQVLGPVVKPTAHVSRFYCRNSLWISLLSHGYLPVFFPTKGFCSRHVHSTLSSL